jgi:hypothetical protein
VLHRSGPTVRVACRPTQAAPALSRPGRFPTEMHTPPPHAKDPSNLNTLGETRLGGAVPGKTLGAHYRLVTDPEDGSRCGAWRSRRPPASLNLLGCVRGRRPLIGASSVAAWSAGSAGPGGRPRLVEALRPVRSLLQALGDVCGGGGPPIQGERRPRH